MSIYQDYFNLSNQIATAQNGVTLAALMHTLIQKGIVTEDEIQKSKDELIDDDIKQKLNSLESEQKRLEERIAKMRCDDN